MPPIAVRFRRFTSLNTTIRLREGQIRVNLSDLLEGAPESVLHSIAHILLAKLYDKKKLDPAQELRYKRFASSAAVIRQTELIRGARGNKRFFGPEGRFYNLEEVFVLAQSALLRRPAGPATSSPGASRPPSAPSAITTPPTTPSSSAASSTGPPVRATPSNTCSTTRCCT